MDPPTEDLCRFCFLNRCCMQLFDEAALDSNVVEIATQRLQIEMSEDDVFPNTMCMDCWQTIVSFHQFRMQVLTNQKEFVETYLENSVKKEEVEEEYIFEPQDEQLVIQSITVEPLDLKADKSESAGLEPVHSVRSVGSSQSDNGIKKRFVCDICGARFEKKHMIRVHILYVHARTRADDQNVCGACDKTFANVSFLNHIFLEHGVLWERKRKHSFKNLSEADRDQFALDNFEMKCTKCGEIFDSWSSSQKHCRTKHKIHGSVTCCGFVLRSRLAVDDHIDWHFNPTLFRCEFCKKDTKNRRGLVCHNQLHMATESSTDSRGEFDCEHCGQSFLTRDRLRRHIRNVHSWRLGKKCHICGKMNLKNLNRHLLTHSETEPPIQVDEDNVEIISKEMEHASENKSICNICNARFEKMDSLKAHILEKHSKSDANACMICNKKFKNTSVLRGHIFIKHGTFSKRKLDRSFRKLTPVERKKFILKNFDMKCTMCDVVFDSWRSSQNHYFTKHKSKHGSLSCCGAVFRSKTMVDDHIDWHFNPELFRCEVCKKDTKNRRCLIGHDLSHRRALTRSGRQPATQKCVKVDGFSGVDNENVEKEHAVENENTYVCDICNARFDNIDNVKAHILGKHTKNDANACNVCDKKFKNSSILRSHMFVRHGTFSKRKLDRSFRKLTKTERNEFILQNFDMKCTMCDAVFDSWRSSQNHYFTKHKARHGSLSCCGAVFRSKTMVDDHIDWHFNPELFRCEVCKKDTKNRRCLSWHDQSHKALDFQERFDCQHCSKSFTLENRLRSHVKIVHSTKYRKICEICAEVCRDQASLVKHLQSHSGQPRSVAKKFPCKLCGAWLASKYSLKCHVEKHSSEPVKCDQCDKISPNVDAHQFHVRYTHSDATLKCHLCTKSFKYSISLKNHIATHSNDRQYKCSYCNETFVWQSNMYKHQKKMHLQEWSQDKAKKSQYTPPT